MEKTNFFGNPDVFKKRMAKMDGKKFKIFLAKKEEQWAFLDRNRHWYYQLFADDPDDARGRDALCMKYLYEEKEKRGIL